jgi:arginine decarboxylase
VTESGRALTAYHTVHVVPVIDVIRVPGENPVKVPSEAHPLVGDLAEGESRLSLKNYSETYHDAIEDRETLETLYSLGLVSLHDRALAEEIFYRIARRIQSLIKELGYVPDEFESLPVLLADQLIGNFSVFHSLPDAWAIDQLFPIVPLAGLNRRPNREAILVDISCDSDGKISHYIDLRDVRSTLPLPPQRAGEPLELGIFLTGAYQEALASEHNLFGAIAEISLRLGQGSEPQWLPKDPAARLLRRVGYRELTPWLPDPQHPLAPAFLEAHRRLVEGTTYLGD